MAASRDAVDRGAGEIALANIEWRDVYPELIDNIEANRLGALRRRARAAAGCGQTERVADRCAVDLDIVGTVILTGGRRSLTAERADLRGEPDVIVQAAGDRWQILDLFPIHVSAGAVAIARIELVNRCSLDRDALGCYGALLGNRGPGRLRRGAPTELQIYISGLLQARVDAALRFRSAIGRGRDSIRTAGADVGNIPAAAAPRDRIVTRVRCCIDGGNGRADDRISRCIGHGAAE